MTANNSSSDKRVVRWWFVIRAEESALVQLQKDWHLVAMQTDWKLTPLLQHNHAGSLQSNSTETPRVEQHAVTSEAKDQTEPTLTAPGKQQSSPDMNIQLAQSIVNTEQQTSQASQTKTSQTNNVSKQATQTPDQQPITEQSTLSSGKRAAISGSSNPRSTSGNNNLLEKTTLLGIKCKVKALIVISILITRILTFSSLMLEVYSLKLMS